MAHSVLLKLAAQPGGWYTMHKTPDADATTAQKAFKIAAACGLEDNVGYLAERYARVLPASTIQNAFAADRTTLKMLKCMYKHFPGALDIATLQKALFAASCHSDITSPTACELVPEYRANPSVFSWLIDTFSFPAATLSAVHRCTNSRAVLAILQRSRPDLRTKTT